MPSGCSRAERSPLVSDKTLKHEWLVFFLTNTRSYFDNLKIKTSYAEIRENFFNPHCLDYQPFIKTPLSSPVSTLTVEYRTAMRLRLSRTADWLPSHDGQARIALRKDINRKASFIFRPFRLIIPPKTWRLFL